MDIDEVKRKEELQEFLAELYQIVGQMANDLNIFETDRVEKVLDNLVAAMEEEPLPHKNLLPFYGEQDAK